MNKRIFSGLRATIWLVAIVGAAPSWAVNKCTGADGAVVFQDAPCAGKGEKLTVRPGSGHANASSAASAARTKTEIADIEWRSKVDAAIARGEPLLGMTRTELDKAMGMPTQVNADNYAGKLKDQIIYDRLRQSWYVYTEDGIVTAIQHRPGATQAKTTNVRCPTSHEIRSMETSASSITLSEAERVQRRKEIAEARKCGQ